MKTYISLSVLALLSAFSFSSNASASAACYRALCVGDHVSAVSQSGYSLYGTVQRFGRDAIVVVEWHYANDWPYSSTSVWPYALLKKVN